MDRAGSSSGGQQQQQPMMMATEPAAATVIESTSSWPLFDLETSGVDSPTQVRGREEEGWVGGRERARLRSPIDPA